MTFLTALRVCLFQKYAVCRGRASRSEYWWFTFFTALVWLGAAALSFSLFMSWDSLSAFAPGGLMVLVLGPPVIGVNVRRLHDLNMPGFLYFVFVAGCAVPVAQGLVFLAYVVVLSLPGTRGPNRHGSDPLQGGV